MTIISRQHKSPLTKKESGGSFTVDSLLIVTPIVGLCNCSMFCCALLCVHFSFAIISMGMRELVALLFVSFSVS